MLPRLQTGTHSAFSSLMSGHSNNNFGDLDVGSLMAPLSAPQRMRKRATFGGRFGGRVPPRLSGLARGL